MSKIATMPEFKKIKKGGIKALDNHPVLKNPALRLLFEDVRESLDEEYSNT